jgi:sodium-dependent dicarboxylate transporter 2/3/5
MPEEGRSARLRKAAGLAAGVAAFLAIALIPSGLHRVPGEGSAPAYAAGIAALMAIWWFTEALPIHWTALVPLAAYPLLGIFEPWAGREGAGALLLRNAGRAAAPYADAYIFLFLGGMMIGAAAEQWNLHRRVALHILRAVGVGPRRLLFGVLAATAFVSLWISNTATAVMMMPIGRALLAQLEASAGGRRLWNFGAGVMLAVAYGSNVGGIGTKIGTGPNSILCGWVQRHMGLELSFPYYMLLALPFVMLFLPVVWGVLWERARRDPLEGLRAREVLERELAALGPMSRPEKKVLAVFLTAAALWIFGNAIRPGIAPWVPRFWEGFQFREKHYEAAVAVGAGMALLALRLLAPARLLRIPWDTLLLLGGGFALAAGVEGSGLSEWLALRLRAVAGLPLPAQVGLAALFSVGLSAVASNTATINVLIGLVPRSLPVLFAVTLGSSCDFMLPAGTPPNAIVFGSGYIRLPVMIRTGFALDLAAVLTITLYASLYLRWIAS